MIKKIVKALLIIIISNSIVIKAYSIEPDVFIQSAVNRATKALGAEDKTELYKALRSIAEDTVDINGIGLYSLGSYRKTLTKEQSIKYQSLFREYFLKSFCSRLEEYTNPEINVISKNKLNENYTIVSSILEKTEIKLIAKRDT